jgi:hypothetical protein
MAMTNKELMAAIRKYTGPIYAGVIIRNDVVYVQVVKKDLLSVMAGKEDEAARATERHGALYIDN